MNKSIRFTVILTALSLISFAQEGSVYKPLEFDGHEITYHEDQNKNRIPDFSYAGYQAGEKEIPDVPVKAIVTKSSKDATRAIQDAIDYVASLKADVNGFKGAVLLEPGKYLISGTLFLNQSGVVLRGAGAAGDQKTILYGDGETRKTLVKIGGQNNRVVDTIKNEVATFTPAGALTITLSSNHGIKKGDQVLIKRPSTDAWIKELKTDHFGGGITAIGWKEGRRDIYWDRKVLATDGNQITLDAPITTSLDPKYGGGEVYTYSWEDRVKQVGIEDIKLESYYNPENPKDENHRWMAITLDGVENAWVRRIEFQHFAGSAVYALQNAKKITVEDCIARDPVSEIGGQRRYVFHTKGQQTLFQRIYSEQGYHDFAVGYLAAGPNAFVQCEANDSYSFSGAVDSWASGVLFDIVNINNQALRFANLGQNENGGGWAAANSVFWQCASSMVECYQPPSAQNWAFGTWAQFKGDGYWQASNEHVKPRSLYYAQLQDRLKAAFSRKVVLMPDPGSASSSPSLEVAAELSKKAYQAPLTLQEFITGILLESSGDNTTVDRSVKRFDPAKTASSLQGIKAPLWPVRIHNGWLTAKDQILIGGKSDVQWWNGSARAYALKDMKPHITRFVPGEVGTGLTDDLYQVRDWMVENHILSMDHNYGLWYERRRDDHERIKRLDGEVWPPFYELPFSRSGIGTAYDGLSKYDLTKYNPFYWNRLKKFADLGEQEGLMLIHQHYFQHNILEAGAHYTDFPWRTANNINDVGLPEPVPYAGDKRIFIAEQFYDITNDKRRALHESFIRKSLENFKDNSNVLHLISEEFTGPLHFVEFWLDVIGDWTSRNESSPLIGLSATKDVQDAILKDPKRSAHVQVIDIKYWHYQKDGTIYAPEGGKHLAPRQHARVLRPKGSDAAQIHRAVFEYKTQYPEKVVVYHGDGYDKAGWAIFMAGGSMANLPKATDKEFLKQASKMSPAVENDLWVLQGDDGMVVYLPNQGEQTVHLPGAKNGSTVKVRYINPSTGEIEKQLKEKYIGSNLKLSNGDKKSSVVWITY